MEGRIQLSAALVRTHQAGVWRYLRFLGADPALADDLTQETFLAVVDHPPRDLGTEACAAWLRATGRRLFLATRRPGRVAIDLVPEAQLEQAWVHLAGDSEGEDYLQALGECMATLDRSEYIDTQRVTASAAVLSFVCHARCRRFVPVVPAIFHLNLNFRVTNLLPLQSPCLLGVESDVLFDVREVTGSSPVSPTI